MAQMCPKCSRNNRDNVQACTHCQEPLLGLLGKNTMLDSRYQVTQVLGCGGFGAVYLAEDSRISKRQVAVKENRPDPTANPQAVAQTQQQFRAEVDLMIKLHHPGLPNVSDQFTEPLGRQYMVMDYIEGETLEDIIQQRGALPEAEIIDLTHQLLNILEYLHNQQPPIVHRDVKPPNIKRRPDGQIVLVDFGIAKVHGQGTQSWAKRAGTPGFAPLEQYGHGGASTDARSDIYSLGAVLYYLLTGQEPPSAPDLAAGASLTPPRKQKPQISLEIQRVVFKAMAVNVNHRYQSIAEMRKALLGGAGKSLPSPPLPKRVSLFWITATGVIGITLTCLALFLVVALNAQILSPAATSTLTLTSIVVSGEASPTGTPTAPSVETPSPLPTPIRTPTLTSQPTATHTPIPTTPAISEMVRIPADSFIQGSTVNQVDDAHNLCTQDDNFSQCWRSSLDDEVPQHAVYINDFYIDKYEVTNAQYAKCVEADFCDPPSPLSSNTHSAYFDNPEYAYYPVIYVTWSDADRYCRWADMRLPTEAEWEKAARGVNGLLWPWGNSYFPERSNIRPGEVRPDTSDTTQVGSYPGGASPYGVMDMVGNVWEWVADWYDDAYYTRSISQNPTGPAPGEEKVIRGGSWNSNIGSARVASRASAPPGARYFDIGFRCAR